jgi:hypothetical protein
MPKTFTPKTTAQLRAIFGLGRKRRCTDEDLRELAYDVTSGRIERLSQLSFDEANSMITRLGGDAFTTSRVPRRTVNYHRQQAGVKQIAQSAHLHKMQELADGRGITEEGLKNLCRRMLGHYRPLTTSETNKIIEALKAMNARDAKKAQEGAGV